MLIVGKPSAVWDLYKKMRRDYDAEISALNALAIKEREEKEKLLAKYNYILKEIEKKYAADQEKLVEEKKKFVKDLIRQYKDDPEGLSKQLAKEFGINYT
jgi:flagellar motility protein MotE (MotC chaperone)